MSKEIKMANFAEQSERLEALQNKLVQNQNILGKIVEQSSVYLALEEKGWFPRLVKPLTVRLIKTVIDINNNKLLKYLEKQNELLFKAADALDDYIEHLKA